MSDLVKVRKYVATVEETLHDVGPVLARPVTKAVVGGVIANPYAGRHVDDIQPMMKALEPLAVDLTERVMKILGAKGSELEAYGKGAIVGLNGELEHAALWHQPSGFGIRHAMGGAKSIVPSTVKVAAAGARIDIPLHHVTAAYVRSHFDAIEFCVPDGPRPDEIVFIVAASIGGRPHARVGGLTPAEIKLGRRATMNEDALAAAMKAMDDYIDGLNRGDEAAVNNACNFPHVRAGRRQGRRLAQPRRLQARRFRRPRRRWLASQQVGRAHADPCRPRQGPSQGEVQPLARRRSRCSASSRRSTS